MIALYHHQPFSLTLETKEGIHVQTVSGLVK